MKIFIFLLILFYIFGQIVGFKGIANYSDTASSLENRAVATAAVTNQLIARR